MSDHQDFTWSRMPCKENLIYFVGILCEREDPNCTCGGFYLRGIFSDKQKAIEACTDDYHFVGVLELNRDTGGGNPTAEHMIMAWFPSLQEEPEDREEYLKRQEEKNNDE